MEKAHSRIKWENYPSIATPLNETNLNKMDIALDEVDNRVLGLDTAKLDKAVANTMVKDIAFNEKTGIFTITLLDGTTKTIDTKLEKVATNFSYDYETQKLVLTLVDGTEQEIDMSTLISQYEFADTSTIGFTVGNEGKITAIVKDGSITEAKLQPNFLANVKTEVSKAKSYADSSYENATTSRNAVTEAKQYRDEALQFRNEAESFAPEGYADLVEQVQENTVKVDTIIAKADLGIKETASGEEIHLIDSAEGKAVEFALYGKAKQNTTSGKNLLENVAVNMQKNGITFVINEDKSITANGTATQTSDFYVNGGYAYTENILPISSGKIISSGTKTNLIQLFLLRNESVIAKAESGEDISISLTGELTAVMYRVPSGVTLNNVTIYPMIRKCDENGNPIGDDTYEQFTNGASPNPQYPQPIEVSGASGSVVVRTYSPIINEIPMEQGAISAESKEYSALKVPSTTRIRTVDIIDTKNSKVKIEWNDLIYDLVYHYFGMDKILYGVYGETNVWHSTSPNIANSSGYIAIAIKRKDGANITVEEFENVNLKILIDGKETTATIPTENGLVGINDIRDEKVKYADGSGEDIQRFEKVVLDGTQALNGPYNVTAEQNQFNFYNVLSNAKIDGNGISTHFVKSVNNTIGFRAYSETHLMLIVPLTIASTVDELKAWLSENNVTVYYELAEPIRTPLTAEEIAEIEKLHTFYPITNISNDFDCGMKVKYNCDSKNYIDNKIALLTTAMVNNI